ncbi:MAG: transcriptional regulator [Acidimicrobiaceae bacterium]|nr:MAG: transcriptional regulator [Acidimicrobiaceae bacterium]
MAKHKPIGEVGSDTAFAAAPSAHAERDRDHGAFTATVSAITNAFGDPTRRAIYLFARTTEHGVTAAQVAAQFGLHPNVARHHLDRLAAGGYLEGDRASRGLGCRATFQALPLRLRIPARCAGAQ